MFACFITPGVQVLVLMVDLMDCIVTCDVRLFQCPRCSGVGHNNGSLRLYCIMWCSPVSVSQVLAMVVDLEDCVVTYGVHLIQCPRCWHWWWIWKIVLWLVFTCFSVPGVGHDGGLEDCIVTCCVHLFQCPGVGIDGGSGGLYCKL